MLLAIGGLVVSVLAGSNPTEDSGFLWLIKIPSTHFLRSVSKAIDPMP
jgi:hypothetical protein